MPNTIELVTNSLNEISRSLTEDFIPLMRNLSAASDDFPILSENFNETLIQLKETLEKINISTDNLPEIAAKLNEVIADLGIIARDFKEIAAAFKQNPSQVIFGDAPEQLGIDRK